MPPSSDQPRPRGPWIDPISRVLISTVDGRVEEASERRHAYGILEGWVGLVLNGVLFAIKLTLGLMVGSVSLIADAVHTAADSITSAVLIVSSRIARRPADREHPFGHGRVESVAAVVIAVLLGVAGIEFLQSSIERIVHPEPIEAGWWVVGVVVALAAVKEWNSRFALALAHRSGSAAIAADAWHHRSDVFATLLVAVGITGAKLGVPILDGAMGIGVSLVILWTAVQLARESVNPLIGSAPTPEEVEEVARTARAIDGVVGVHDIVIHHYGDVRVVSLHIETSDKETALRLHTVAEMVQDGVSGGRKGHVVVHVDPINRDHPRYEEAQTAMQRIVASDPRLRSFHDLRIVGEEERFNVILDVVVAPDVADEGEVRDAVAAALRQESGAAAVVVHVEPLFAYGDDDPQPS
jgi:cation diffusion facilitator family transporter